MPAGVLGRCSGEQLPWTHLDGFPTWSVGQAQEDPGQGCWVCLGTLFGFPGLPLFSQFLYVCTDEACMCSWLSVVVPSMAGPGYHSGIPPAGVPLGSSVFAHPFTYYPTVTSSTSRLCWSPSCLPCPATSSAQNIWLLWRGHPGPASLLERLGRNQKGTSAKQPLSWGRGDNLN